MRGYKERSSASGTSHGTLLGAPVKKAEIVAQPLGQQARGQRAIPVGRTQPGSGTFEKRLGYPARRVADGEHVRADHLFDII